jgi:CRP/FNR family transcriptional regulator
LDKRWNPAAVTRSENLHWIDEFPELRPLSAEARQALVEAATVITVPPMTRVFAPGQKPESFLLVLEGTVRVQQVSESGREIVLYRVGRGQSCILTTTCLLSDEDYLAEGLATTPLRAVAIPRYQFDRLISGYPEFRSFVFHAYSERITSLLLLLGDVAFSRIDKRLAQKILALASPEGELQLTHHELAVELGTAREVITRQLRAFQEKGYVDLDRGRVRILDRTALEKLGEANG